MKYNEIINKLILLRHKIALINNELKGMGLDIPKMESVLSAHERISELKKIKRNMKINTGNKSLDDFLKLNADCWIQESLGYEETEINKYFKTDIISEKVPEVEIKDSKVVEVSDFYSEDITVC